MQTMALFGAGVVLVGTVAVGLVAHELTHALALYSLGVPYEIQWLPGGEQSEGRSRRFSGTLAVVTPSQIPTAVPTRGIQLSALAPLLLTLPLLLVLSGVLPLAPPTDNPYVTALTVAWLGCSLPSPQDFSVFWYAEDAVADLNDAAVSDE